MAINPQQYGANFGVRGIKIAALRLSDDPHTPTTDYAELLVGDGVPSGGYGRDSGATMLYFRKDASSVNGALYLTVNGGTAWTALSSAAVGSIADTNTYYTTDTIDGAFNALALQIGGTSDAAYNFTNGTGSLVADNDSVYAALNKLDQGFVTLLSTANGKGASKVSIEDSASLITATTVEGALAELAAVDQHFQKTTTTINNAATKTLHASPVTIIAAPGAGKAIVDVRLNVKYVYATAAFDSVGGGDDFEIRYTDGSGTKVANDIETTGMMDQASDQYRMSGPVLTSLTPLANAPVVLTVAGSELFAAAGGGSLVVQAFYRIVTL